MYLWAESRACTLYWNMVYWRDFPPIPTGSAAQNVFGAIPSSSILRPHLYTTLYSMELPIFLSPPFRRARSFLLYPHAYVELNKGKFLYVDPRLRLTKQGGDVMWQPIVKLHENKFKFLDEVMNIIGT